MKKIIGFIVLAMVVILPMHVDAGLAFNETIKTENGIPGSKDGFYCEVTKRVNPNDDKSAATEETCYIIGRATDGSSISNFTGVLTLQNMTIKSITANGPWVNQSNGTQLKFTSSTPVSDSKFTIATIVLDINVAGSYCAVQLHPCYDDNGKNECGNKIEITEKYTCRVVGGKYYGKNGNEVTEAVYNAECVNNPQTGSSMPYIVIIAGIVLAISVFTISRKNTKLYKI